MNKTKRLGRQIFVSKIRLHYADTKIVHKLELNNKTEHLSLSLNNLMTFTNENWKIFHTFWTVKYEKLLILKSWAETKRWWQNLKKKFSSKYRKTHSFSFVQMSQGGANLDINLSSYAWNFVSGANPSFVGGNDGRTWTL